MNKLWEYLCGQVRRRTQRTGFSQAIVGLSGGVDSAVTACITCQALDKENLLGLIMPSDHSSPGSKADALALAETWGFETREIAISTLIGLTEDLLCNHVLEEKVNQVTHENLQARIRAVLLMAVCNHDSRLLINTCNKSEDLVGYCTLYGDSCGSFAPLGDLYKTEVYQLARWINEQDNLPNIPESTLTKEPSAELSDGQLDTDDIPPYDTLDPILRQLTRYRNDQYIVTSKTHLYSTVGKETDASPELVEKVDQLMESNKFKRDQSAPPILIPFTF